MIRRPLTRAFQARAPLAGGWLAILLLLLAASPRLSAEIQFDVFFGFDDHVREGHWFPVAFEIRNDGPTFNGTVRLAPEGGLDSQTRSFSLELPTGTRKRTTIPVFSAAGRYTRWEAQLVDSSGKLLAERTGIQPKDTVFRVPVIGALPRSFGGLPKLPEIPGRLPEYQAKIARLQADYLPSSPIALEALTAIYLNSEKAAELKPESVEALLGWVYAGGHLIVAIEQPGDINASAWLRPLPFAPDAVTQVHLEGSFERWLVSGRRVLQVPAVLRRPPSTAPRRPNRPGRVVVQTPATADPRDPFAAIVPQNDFNNAEIGVVTGRPLAGQTILGLGNLPLIQSAPTGRGTVTVLAFSPEREPFHGWKNQPWFWAKLTALPNDLLLGEGTPTRDGISIDGVFGAMLDSRQVRKLPVAALLLLLLVYLVVIGPFDQWILKRINRQMWTWITFPAYVLIFSGLIYFIGYRLRAGDLEWNEMQVVDQLPRGESAAFRGRTWASIYSPSNARYRFASEQPFASFRAEFQSAAMGQRESTRLVTTQPAHGFNAEAFVPVWVNQLYASDWFDAGPPLLAAQVQTNRTTVHLVLANGSDLEFQDLQIVVAGRLHSLGQLAPHAKAEKDLPLDGGTDLTELLGELVGTASIVEQRRFAFGSGQSGQLPVGLSAVVLASFAEYASGVLGDLGGRSLASPAAFDVGPLLLRGDAVLFAWAPDQAIGPAIHRFSPARTHRHSVLRLATPLISLP